MGSCSTLGIVLILFLLYPDLGFEAEGFYPGIWSKYFKPNKCQCKLSGAVTYTGNIPEYLDYSLSCKLRCCQLPSVPNAEVSGPFCKNNTDTALVSCKEGYIFPDNVFMKKIHCSNDQWEEVEPCIAPVDGNWTEWSNWTECGDIGYRVRNRTCTNPEPNALGEPCVGDYQEIESCADADECSSNPCQNDACCIDGAESYTCNCKAGFYGTHCEITECTASICQGLMSRLTGDCGDGLCIPWHCGGKDSHCVHPQGRLTGECIDTICNFHPCTADGDCPSVNGLSGSCIDSSVTFPPWHSIPGKVCFYEDQCAGVSCADGEVCDYYLGCIPETQCGDQTCGPDELCHINFCGDGVGTSRHDCDEVVCSGSSNDRCAVNVCRPAGAACSDHEDCVYRLEYCDSSTGTCTLKPESCSTDEECGTAGLDFLLATCRADGGCELVGGMM